MKKSKKGITIDIDTAAAVIRTLYGTATPEDQPLVHEFTMCAAKFCMENTEVPERTVIIQPYDKVDILLDIAIDLSNKLDSIAAVIPGLAPVSWENDEPEFESCDCDKNNNVVPFKKQ